MKEALNKTVSTQRAIAALSLAVFLRFSMPPIPDTSPPFLKGNHAAETLPSNAKSTVSTTPKRLAHTRVRYDGAIETTRREAS